jgi:hypothetical protein
MRGTRSLSDPDAMRVINAMTTQPSAARRDLIHRTVRLLKATVVWYTMDIIYYMAAHDEQAAKLNWKNPGTYSLFVDSDTGGSASDITFTVDRGFTQTVAGGRRINTGFNLRNDSTRYTQENCSATVYVRNNAQSNSAVIYSTDDTQILWLIARTTGNNQVAYVNRGGSNQVQMSSSDSRGLRLCGRVTPPADSNRQYTWIDNGTLSSNTFASSAIPNSNVFLLAAPYECAFACVGSFPGEAMRGDLYNRCVQEYMVAVGANV